MRSVQEVTENSPEALAFFAVCVTMKKKAKGTHIMEKYHQIKPSYPCMDDTEFYASGLMTEYQQSVEEGLDVEGYKDLFTVIAALPKTEIKDKLSEVLFEIVANAQIKNGIYGEMFVAAMIAVAATTSDVEDIILGGLGEIPHTSRLYESIMTVMNHFKNGGSQKDCFDTIHKAYDEYTGHSWCHTISNAMIVAASLLYGGGDFGKSICMAVETGFDTDCNGATVGSVLGMAHGIDGIPTCWQEPIHDTLHTSIFGVGTVKISDRVKMTLEHIKK